jgi:arabinofuranosyltransferase
MYSQVMKRSAALYVLGASALACGVFIARASFVANGELYFSLFDDAMISMRFASNLAAGHGLVWNPGRPPVEGYSNFLWTLWMAVLHLVPVPARLTSLLVSISGAVLILGTAVVGARIAGRLSGNQEGAAPLVSAAMVGLCYPLLYWTLRGMEVGLLAFLIVLSVDWAMRLGDGEQGLVGRLAVCLAVLPLVRPDGLVPAVTIAVCAATAAPDNRLRTLVALCAAPITVMGLHTVWRVSVYGEWLPNTYYLKMTGVTIAERLTRGLEMGVGAFSLYLWTAVAFALAAIRSYARPDRALVLLVPGALIAYSAYVGGDAWEWMPYTNRYVTPAFAVLLPGVAAAVVSRESFTGRMLAGTALACAPLALWDASRSTTTDALVISSLIGVTAAAFAASVNWRAGTTGTAALAALLILLLTSAPGWANWLRTGGVHVQDDADASRLGLILRDSTAPEARIAVVWAGAIPYFAERETIDLLGKNDARIARTEPVTLFFPGHNKFDYAYSIGELRPDVVLQLRNPTAKIHGWIVGQGYDHVIADVFVRRDSQWVDRTRFARIQSARFP